MASYTCVCPYRSFRCHGTVWLQMQELQSIIESFLLKKTPTGVFFVPFLYTRDTYKKGGKRMAKEGSSSGRTVGSHSAAYHHFRADKTLVPFLATSEIDVFAMSSTVLSHFVGLLL